MCVFACVVLERVGPVRLLPSVIFWSVWRQRACWTSFRLWRVCECSGHTWCRLWYVLNLPRDLIDKESHFRKSCCNKRGLENLSIDSNSNSRNILDLKSSKSRGAESQTAIHNKIRNVKSQKNNNKMKSKCVADTTGSPKSKTFDLVEVHKYQNNSYSTESRILSKVKDCPHEEK